ncbi:NarK/NasA family nitrate transporter [Rubellimicrobium roseum]|uniref:NarK/NasA family nitrate transporter n=2 Tax=Rubellimicrobium roseum TaxID=687525 RepID=A0A5C4NJN7_9RHOB|nr:NarK/NasA family nitrate transporter [Rubellimicrobium roseum]
MSTTAFTVCFAVWTIFSIIGIRIKEDLGLSETAFGLLIGVPVLSGSLVRLVLGIWTDRFGGRIVYTATMLSAALATALLSFAQTYPQMLLAGLGVGLAGGSFAVGVAYVSRFYPAGKQGTALGIFGVGNVGAAVTKFVAPFVLVAYGWQTVALVWAAALAVMAVVFWLTTEDDPVIRARRKGEVPPPRPFLKEFEPLRDLRVWRFSLYYFFTFGAFVALALWLPRYLVGVYGFDIATAGLIGAAYSIPGSIFRAYGGVLSDRIGARKVLWWTLAVSGLCTLVLSTPSTFAAPDGSVAATATLAWPLFMAVTFVLGFFMSLGKAAVYKHIPAYYPGNVGAVGGLVGMIGGLGGFVLPLAFGALKDTTGLASSCFMLLFVLIAACFAWMTATVRRLEAAPVPAE